MMSRFPELQIRCDQNSIPVSAKCSACGEQMPQGKPRIIDPMDNVTWFAAQFDIHLKRMHAREGGNQSVARTVTQESPQKLALNEHL
jgi:hypothetical protein